MFVNIARSLETKETHSFALESEINVGDIYTFDSTFVPLEKTTDIFIDTVKIKYEGAFVTVGKNSPWKYDNRNFQYFLNVPVNDTNIKLTFKKDRNDEVNTQMKHIKVKKGTVYIEMSVPKVLYGTNVCGISSSDINVLYEELASLLTDADVEFSYDGSHLDFENYKVTRIDRSFCFNAGSEDAKDEYMRIFRKLRIPFHKPGRCKQFDDYDYDTGFSHGSDSSDCIIYDKSEESDIESEPDILRLEIRCRKPKGQKSDFGLFGEVLNNQTLIDILQQYRLDLKILPEREFFKTIKAFLAAERNMHRGEKARKLPKYLQYEDKTILEFFQYINDYSEVAAYLAESTLFNVCKTITTKLGIMNLYTIIDEELSFVDNVLSRTSSIKKKAAPLEEVVDEPVTVKDETTDVSSIKKEDSPLEEDINLVNELVTFKVETTKTDDKPYKGVSIADLIVKIGKPSNTESVYLFVVDFLNLIANKQPIPYKRE